MNIDKRMTFIQIFKPF